MGRWGLSWPLSAPCSGLVLAARRRPQAKDLPTALPISPFSSPKERAAVPTPLALSSPWWMVDISRSATSQSPAAAASGSPPAVPVPSAVAPSGQWHLQAPVAPSSKKLQAPRQCSK
jgi:hypothetical protein